MSDDEDAAEIGGYFGWTFANIHDPLLLPQQNGRWVWIPDDDRPEEPYDDTKDHDPCPDCNPKGKGRDPGWYQPLVGPKVPCTWCEGAGWL